MKRCDFTVTERKTKIEESPGKKRNWQAWRRQKLIFDLMLHRALQRKTEAKRLYLKKFPHISTEE